jgi:uncharacterized protein YciI
MVAAIAAAQGQSFMWVFLHKKQQATEMPKDQLDKLMEGHMANIQRLAKEGKLIAAGPFEGGGGIFVFNSNSKERVQEWLSTDPGVKAERWRVEILPFHPRKGSVCPVKEPYEMTMYTFIRFSVNLTKYTIGDASEVAKEHERFMGQHTDDAGVITEGSFGTQEGSILILKDGASKDWIGSDPAIQKGLVEYETKQLYIAKGAFCEK